MVRRAISYGGALALVVVMASVAHGRGGEEWARIPVDGSVAVFATHTRPSGRFELKYAFDGDAKTHWGGDGHALTSQPTNLVIQFAKPTTVERIVLASFVFQERLALKHFEVYAWGEKTWAGGAPLAVVRDARRVRTVVNFDAVQTRRLRIRLRDTWEPGHGLPRLTEIELYGPRSESAGRHLADSPLADEKKSERELLARTLGESADIPPESFDPAKGYLHYARAFLDTMIAKGTDRYGPVHSPMFASLLDLETQENPADTPASIPGQRDGDRSARGGNLMHDVMLLRACDTVTSLTGDPRYRRAATDYLQFFLEHCPQATGLFPWGEHAHWDFYKEAPGNPTHEFLGGGPISFWERLWALNPRAVCGEADGLINHVVNLETYDYNRHANILKPLPIPRAPGMGFLDFPRHGGFFIGVWTFAHAKTGDPKYLEWSLQVMDHHWRLRHPVSGWPPAPKERGREGTAMPGSLLSMSVSLLEAAALLPKGKERARYEETARAYLDGNLRLPHRAAEGKLMGICSQDKPPEQARGPWSDPYHYGYGGAFTADGALLLLAAHRLTGEARALELASRCAEYYAQHEPPPRTEVVRAHVYASIVTLFCDLYDLRRKASDLRQAERYAQLAIERLFHRGLFRGATGVTHYEGDMMVGNLVYALVWLHALKEKAAVKVEPNYYNR